MDTAAIQRPLIARDYDLGKGGPSGRGDDGVWGDRTTAALIAHQKKQGLLGDIGERAIALLQAPIAAKPAAAQPADGGEVPAGWLPAARIERVIVPLDGRQPPSLAARPQPLSCLDRGRRDIGPRDTLDRAE